MKKAAKPHPEDILIAKAIANAVEFSAFYRNGPHEKYIVRGLPDYATARREADQLAAKHSKFARGAMVYAITPEGYSHPCDDRMMALAAEYGDISHAALG